MAEVLRCVVRRAMVLLELGEFVRGARPNVQAELAVDVLQFDRAPVRAREIARIDVPDHAAGIFVGLALETGSTQFTAFPLLNDRSVVLRAVPRIHALSGAPVQDEKALGAEVDAPRTVPRRT